MDIINDKFFAKKPKNWKWAGSNIKIGKIEKIFRHEPAIGNTWSKKINKFANNYGK